MSLYGKIEVPTPKDYFIWRTRQLLAFWIFGKFRKGKSDLSGENLITILPEKTCYPVYTAHEWYSDDWDAMEYGREYDFFKTIF